MSMGRSRRRFLFRLSWQVVAPLGLPAQQGASTLPGGIRGVEEQWVEQGVVGGWKPLLEPP